MGQSGVARDSGMTVPKGILVAVGGAEDKEDDMVILGRVIDEVKGTAKRVEILAGASRKPRDTASPYLKAFDEMGIEHVDWIALDSRREADDARTVARLKAADVIYFTGGDQARLVDALHGTKALTTIRARYMGGAVIAGSSAGAAAMSSTMLVGGQAEEALNKGSVRTAPGLGFLPDAVIDTHFLQRARFARLLEVVTQDPSLTGIGISEDTAVVIRGGRELEIVGADNVIVFDGSEVQHTNVLEAEKGDALVVARAVVHALAAGCHYDLKTRALRVPKLATGSGRKGRRALANK